MNDPKTVTNPRFAAFLAKRKNGAASSVSSLLQATPTNGMVLYGILDSVRRMPAKRTPGSIYVTIVTSECKIYDDTMFTQDNKQITINADEHNAEPRELKNMTNVVVGGFEFDEDIENSVGAVVKCYGFIRNKAGFCTSKLVKVQHHLDKTNTILELPITIPSIEFGVPNTQRFVGTILQFRAASEAHDDWKPTCGNACSMIVDPATYRTDGDELLFKGSAESMSYDERGTKMYLFELYWPSVCCKKFGITNVESWSMLAPTMLPNLRGFVKANIDVVKSSGLSINENPQAEYAGGYAIYSNHVEVDLAYVVRTTGTPMTGDKVFEYFDEEYMLEYEGATDNPLNHSSSLVKNLSEYSGNLKKVLDAPGAEFYKIGTEAVCNIFVVLVEPLRKKKRSTHA